jgi:WD40 repeat protein
MNITNKSVIAPLSTFNDNETDYSVDAIYSLAFSPDGNYLATSSYYDDYVSIMNITNKSVIAPLSTFNDNETDYSVDGIRSLAFSPDGNYLATSSYDDDYVSIMQLMVVEETTPPTFTNIANISVNNITAVYYDVNATDASGISCFAINDTTNFNIDCNGVLTNKTYLPVGFYVKNISVNDTLNNIASQLISINVTAYVSPPTDSCTCTNNTNWIINLTDFCSLTYDCSPINVSFIGTGTFNISSTLNVSRLNLTGLTSPSIFHIKPTGWLRGNLYGI